MEKKSGDPGEIRNDSRAASAPNIKPSIFRLFRYSDDILYLFSLFLKLGIVGGLVTYGSSYLLNLESGLKVLGWIGIVGGSIILLFALFLFALVIIGLFHRSMCYKNGLMTTGIVQSVNPVSILYMANISTGMGPSLHGLRLTNYKKFPGKPTVGEEIPAVSVFQGEGFSETWDTFTATPLIFGSDNQKHLEAALNALAREDFAVMRKCMQQSIVPKSESELVIIEEDGTFVETRNL